jgi:hypothetical protein
MAKARRDLEQALHVMAGGGSYQAEEWMLLATLVGEADLALRAAPAEEAAPLLPLLDRATTELRDITDGFSRAEYLSATGAARRRNPALLNPR